MNIKNRTIFEGDNLNVLLGMETASVDLIYLDPPFNSNRTYEAPVGSEAAGAMFKDSWTMDDVKQEWRDSVALTHPSLYDAIRSAGNIYGRDMEAYLVMMSVRLIELQRILKPTGSIYLHCDPTASHYLKMAMDAIFGKDNFRNEIVWHHPKIGIAKKQFTSNNDTILFYSNSDDYEFHPIRSDEPNELAKRWKTRLRGNKLYYREAKDIKDNPAQSKIRVIQKKLGRNLNDNDVVVDFNEDKNKKAIDNVWKISFVKGNSKESTGYPTQKPLSLLERIIKASSNQGDVVLDPFCGCATTCVAAEKLGRQWIGIDISPKAVELVRSRLEDTAGFLGQVYHRTDTPDDNGYKMTHQNKGNIKQELFTKQQGICPGCFESPGFKYFDVDHILPQSKDGGNSIDNLQLLCHPCNTSKGNRTMKDLADSNLAKGHINEDQYRHIIDNTKTKPTAIDKMKAKSRKIRTDAKNSENRKKVRKELITDGGAELMRLLSKE